MTLRSLGIGFSIAFLCHFNSLLLLLLFNIDFIVNEARSRICPHQYAKFP